METIRKNFKIALAKGEYGEQIIKSILERKGFVVYRPATEGAHAFDVMAIKDKQRCIAMDVKAKSRRNNYADTGINMKHYKIYEAFQKTHNMPFWVVFVDEYLMQIYGNTLDNLNMPVVVGGKKYPLHWKAKNGEETIYWPLVNMREIHSLDEAQALHLRSMNQRNHEYGPISFS